MRRVHNSVLRLSVAALLADSGLAISGLASGVCAGATSSCPPRSYLGRASQAARARTAKGANVADICLQRSADQAADRATHHH